ncbi:CpaD family pilus assembly protein [Mesorhizobium sp. LHD-90]|uniref:CpaD family pilus assembly protein n=1 Tax=Mesorhizobium sp. LHD-90 TaxID=3071414 RepID=UPI0027E10744|nr:CpaD family pilus assembly protein [Mesorhizobium sp. LHD-90]MDQ6435761.1 CpaD family pilus assembly protein [Mesorhizobium sp. LHD-90]
MIDNITVTTPAARSHRARILGKPMLALTAAVSVVLMAGCATKTDSVTVGAIPDDYRTNHPIVIAEKEQVIDLPVGAGDRGMTKTQRVALGGFLADYDRSAAPVVTILVPAGSYNAHAASQAGADFAQFAKRRGVPASRIALASYQATSAEVSAPVRVTYTAMSAQTNKCGRWPEDIANTYENKHYANFGCSYQNNLAAQLENPADLLGPRKTTEVDAERRNNVIDAYRNAPVFVDSAVREVDY